MIPTVSLILTGLVGLEHFYILYLEMFQWNTKRVNKIFGLKEEFAKLPQAKVLASNQGLYNGFLAAGLVWSLIAPDPFNAQLATFFNGCVLTAAVFGALTVTPRILYVQGIPAFLALSALYFGF